MLGNRLFYRLFIFMISFVVTGIFTQDSGSSLPPAIMKCGKYICSGQNSSCFQDLTCTCDKAWDTYPIDDRNLTMCGYRKKSKILFLLFEALISFGTGHFYTLRIYFGIIKFLFFGLGLFFMISIRFFVKDENSSLALLLALGGCITCLGMVVWQLMDIFFIVMNYYNDGYGVALN
jgi:hypothetical protein